MNFENNVPEWRAKGTEPPESLKEKGFEVGQKPPAAYFNWFWNRVSACLTEIFTKLKGHAENTANPHNVTAAQVGLDKVNNTSDAEKKVAFASESASARKVSNKFVLRFNGGGTENTDLFTYDGSGGKAANITPDKIDAAKRDMSNVAADAFREKASSAGVGIPVASATSADGVIFSATIDGVTELYNGLIITIVPDRNSASTTPKLNVNGLGEKMVRLPLSFNNAAMSMPKMETYISEGRPLTLQYDAAYLNDDGIWKVFGKQKTSGQDLYGTVPVEGGGTGATDAATACGNLGAVKKSGDTMTGDLTTTGLIVTPGHIYPLTKLKAFPNGDSISYGAAMDEAFLAQIVYEDTEGVREYYLLPPYTVGRTDHAWHYILTSKSPVTIAQGGTGAKDAAGAVANLWAEIAKMIEATYNVTKK